MFCYLVPWTIAVQCYTQASAYTFLLLIAVKTSRAQSLFVIREQKQEESAQEVWLLPSVGESALVFKS